MREAGRHISNELAERKLKIETEKQQTLGRIYTGAVDKLRTSNDKDDKVTKIFSSRQANSRENRLSIGYKGPEGGSVIIVTSDVSDQGEVPEIPSHIRIGGSGVGLPEASYWIRRGSRYTITVKSWSGVYDHTFRYNPDVGRRIENQLKPQKAKPASE